MVCINKKGSECFIKKRIDPNLFPNKDKDRIHTVWQGRRDSNTQQTVLETVALPLNYSPKSFVSIHKTPDYVNNDF